MSASDARIPPRFVPTLTDVVVEQPLSVAQGVDDAPDAAAAVSVISETRHSEPYFVAPDRVANVQQQKAVPVLSANQAAAVALSLQERVMARLDESLEERLRYALADMVQLHTQALYQAIRQDVEQLVSASVHEAIAQELADMRKSSSNECA